MKKLFLTLGLVALLSFSATSCSTDDSALETSSETLTPTTPTMDNGDRDLPKPPQHP